VVPDIAALGKIIGGGFPLAAVVGSEEIMRHLAPAMEDTGDFVQQAGTLNGNPVAAAAGLATLAELRKPGTVRPPLRDGPSAADGAAGCRARAAGLPRRWRAKRRCSRSTSRTAHHGLPGHPHRRPRAACHLHRALLERGWSRPPRRSTYRLLTLKKTFREPSKLSARPSRPWPSRHPNDPKEKRNHGRELESGEVGPG
jgi:hypothetical protein